MLTQCDEATKELSVDQMVQLIKNAPPGPWPHAQFFDTSTEKYKDDPEKSWRCWENTHQAMRKLAAEFIDNELGKKPDIAWSGRGIVIAGGMKPVPHRNLPHGYYPSIWVAVNKIRHTGSRLPIQVWYMGDEEMDPHSKKLLESLDVECVDARKVAQKFPARILCGWELKPYATLYSPFEEVLFLDADNAPINGPPDQLFDQIEYKQTGACFWPDYAHWDMEKGVWDIFGIPYRNEAAFESGQYLVNKKKRWMELRLALWYAEYSDYVFGHVYGDKEVFHLAWRKLGTDYAMPSKRPDWEGECCIVQHDTSGKRVLLHRCQDKWKLNGGNRHVPTLEDEQLHHDICKDLRGIWSGIPWRNTMPNQNESKLIKYLTGKKFSYKRLPHPGFDGDTRDLVFDTNGRIGEGWAKCEYRWDVNEVTDEGSEIPSYMTLALSSEDGKVTCILRMVGNAWKGRWLDHEKCEVELVMQKPREVNPEIDAGEVMEFVERLGYKAKPDSLYTMACFLGWLQNADHENGDRSPEDVRSQHDRNGLVSQSDGSTDAGRSDGTVSSSRSLPILR